MTKTNKSESDDSPEKPKSSPKVSRDTNKSKRSESKEDDPKYRLIRAALEDHLIEHARRHDKRKKTLDEVTSHVEEFLDSFIILGYDYSGESVTLISANTQQQADSLSTLIQKFVVSTQGGSPPMYE